MVPAISSDEVPAGACPFNYKDAAWTSLPRLRNLNVLPTVIPQRGNGICRASLLSLAGATNLYAPHSVAGADGSDREEMIAARVSAVLELPTWGVHMRHASRTTVASVWRGSPLGRRDPTVHCHAGTAVHDACGRVGRVGPRRVVVIRHDGLKEWIR